LKKHYSPAVPTYLTDDDGADRVAESIARGQKVGWITVGEPRVAALTPLVRLLTLPVEPRAYAARLYAALHELEAAGVTAIVIQRPPASSDWAAVIDRLQRAAAE
jgi:L-threonylcarbamoyladenylate synthase